MIKIYKENEINEIVQILKNNGVISIPTDTVFGVCARIDSKIAYDKLIKVKNRPLNKSFPIMCADKEQIKEIAIINDIAEKLIDIYMPGPITLVLKRKSDLPEYITNGKDTVAIRMATSETIKKIIIELKTPIFMTSANKSGEPTCKTLEEIEKMCPELDGIVKGNVLFGKESTIIDCSTNNIKILREGCISKNDIKENLDIIYKK